MFNKSYDQSNHQSVYVGAQPSQQGGNEMVAVAGLVIVATIIIVLVAAVVGALGAISYALVGLFDSVAGVLVALLATVTALVPWLAGGVVIVALVVVALRSLPQAIAEVEDIRYRRALTLNNVRMLEAQNVDDTIFVVRPERAGIER